MKFAIGTGDTVRIYMESEDQGRVALQCQPGEHFWEVVDIPMPPVPIPDLRGTRNQLLTDSDWTQMPDSPFTAEQRAAWGVYRQALRDMIFDDPEQPPVWPEQPS